MLITALVAIAPNWGKSKSYLLNEQTLKRPSDGIMFRQQSKRNTDITAIRLFHGHIRKGEERPSLDIPV